MDTTAPATAIAIPAKPAAVANDDPPGGLTSDEARRRLADVWPERDAGYQHASVAHGPGEILGAGAMDA